MTANNNKIEELTAIQVLRQTGVDVLEAALVAKRALEAGRGRVKRAVECIAAGKEELRRREKTVSFERAIREALETRRNRRKRTLDDFRYIMRRFLKRCEGLSKRRVRSITPAECAAYIRQAFDTPRQRNKARLILSGVFTTACKRGWCAENPVRKVEPEHIEEKRITILNKEEIERLMSAAEAFDGGSCLAAIAIMLYAGVRPNEVERLRWSDVRLDDGVICIAPRHSKTGGARHVTIFPPLERILKRIRRPGDERICPPNWRRRRARLHRKAGFRTWQPDVLRHTFATHHLAAFRNYAELQLEMGHRSAEQLRTRYIAMEGMKCREGFMLGSGEHTMPSAGKERRTHPTSGPWSPKLSKRSPQALA